MTEKTKYDRREHYAHEDDYEWALEIGKMIRNARQSMNPKMSQDALADKAGVLRVHISRYENATSPVHFITLKRIMDALDTDMFTLSVLPKLMAAKKQLSLIHISEPTRPY